MFLIKTNISIGTAIIDELFKLNDSFTFESVVSLVCINKRNRISSNFGILWYSRLGHISPKRVNRLVKDSLLGSLDFTKFETYIDYISKKQSTHIRNMPLDA